MKSEKLASRGVQMSLRERFRLKYARRRRIRTQKEVRHHGSTIAAYVIVIGRAGCAALKKSGRGESDGEETGGGRVCRLPPPRQE